MGRRNINLRDYKDKLVSATIELMRQGIDNVSMRKVARKVGISPAGIYKLFPSKEKLLLEAARVASLQFKQKVLSLNSIDAIVSETLNHASTNRWIIRYLGMKDPSFNISIYKDIIDHMGKIIGNRAKASVIFRLASLQGMIGGKEEEQILWDIVDYLTSESSGG